MISIIKNYQLFRNGRIHQNYRKRHNTNEYEKRDRRNNLTINNWKRKVNNYLGKNIKKHCRKNPKILSVDSIKRDTRYALIRYGFESHRIQSVNRTAPKNTRGTYNGELSSYFEENSKKKFDAVWIDTINSGSNGSHLFKKFMLNHARRNCIVGSTITTRGRKSHGNSRDTPNGYNNMVNRFCEKYNWTCVPIEMPSELRIKEQCGGKNIPKNWAYNGSHGITGGTMTAFWYIEKE